MKALKLPETDTAYSVDWQSSITITRRQTYDRLHHLLRSLLHLIPTLPSALWPLVNRHFPHKRENRNSQVVFMTNVLQILEYCPQLGENILGAVIMRAIQIDAEIQVDIEDLEDDDGALDEEVFGFTLENPFDRFVGDEDTDSESDDGEAVGVLDPDEVSSDDAEVEADAEVEVKGKGRVLSTKVVKRLKDMAAKLDAILRVIFDFLHRLNGASAPTHFNLALSPIEQSFPFHAKNDFLVSDNSSMAAAGVQSPKGALSGETGAIFRRTIFDVLLSIFDEKILRTFQTRHTQFLLFWYSSLSPDFTDLFLGTLVGRALDDKDTPTVSRVAAAGYVASFVSRATAIDRTGARRVMGLLCSFLEDEMDELRYATNNVLSSRSAKRSDGGVMDEHIIKISVVFYAVCQAALYIFCFRWKDLLDEAEDDIDFLDGVPAARRWMSDLDALKQAVGSPLNPLRVSLQALMRCSAS